MAMGQEVSLPLDALFGDFVYDKSQEKVIKKTYSGSQLEREMRAYAKTYLNRFEEGLTNIDRLVMAELLGQEDHFRRLTKRETSRFGLAQFITGLVGLVSLVGIFLSLAHEQFIYLIPYLTLLALTIFIFAVSLSAHTKDLTYGVPTSVGQEALTNWNGFRLMLKSIKRFDSAELDSLVVWNRILVFATMFGSAKQVQSYMRLHNLTLPADTGLTTLTYHPRLFSSAIHHNLISSSHQATQTSHFSVPSSSGGSGGGFSGGGGGGGGGSF